MPFGYADTQWVQFPEGQTEQRLRGLQNRLSINYLEFVTRVDAAVNALNGTDSLISLFTADTTNDHFTSGVISDKVWQRSAEYTPGRPQRGRGGRGHYIPLYHYEIDLGFTDRALQTMTIEQFNDELRTTVQAVAKGRRADVLDRLFFPGEVPLDDNGNGASPGFAGSGTGANAFVGILPNGSYTDPSYTHYHQAEDTDEAIEEMIVTMRDKMAFWQRGPYDLIGGQDAIDRIKRITGDDLKFVSAGSTLVRPGTEQSEARVDPDQYEGVFAGNIRIRYPEYQLEGMSFAIFKAGGPKPLAWRYDPIYGREAYVDDRRLMPLTEAAIMQSYGIGVGQNRTGVTLGSIGGDAGVYVPPFVVR